ncbi:hypothetical protein [Nocardioides sp.]|uniref:hypothetical protein n=1 Tax=Nocardioides sp. TaxID=35761 RepID=UPI001A26FF02|nr:hypothetical protein [Nocardioides sp.]MBJ7357504.1 hypothetical protein [Nocardioides sp.]
MTIRPRDLTDLYLSPVAIELDRRLDELSPLPVEELERRVALSTDREAYGPTARAELFMQSLSHLMPLHGWELDYEPRGVRVRHGDHSLVLGVPDCVREYVGR